MPTALCSLSSSVCRMTASYRLLAARTVIASSEWYPSSHSSRLSGPPEVVTAPSSVSPVGSSSDGISKLRGCSWYLDRPCDGTGFLLVLGVLAPSCMWNSFDKPGQCLDNLLMAMLYALGGSGSSAMSSRPCSLLATDGRADTPGSVCPHAKDLASARESGSGKGWKLCSCRVALW